MAERTLAILVGGGPAPGINGVINAATLAARARGWRVLGVPWGFSRIMKGDAGGVRELGEADVAPYATRGGTMLHTSRANPTKDPEALRRVVETLGKLGVTDLVTIGGDDTATSALRVAAEGGGRLRVVHVPKTIDNDLPLPGNAPTFGFETAKDLGARLVRNLAEDARSTGRWYVVTAMGRTAGHLTVGMAVAGGAHLAIIPEEFPPGPIRLDRIADLVEAAIVKRLADGHADGIAVIAEGVLDRMDPSDMEALQNLERDEHGHPRLSEISIGKILREVLGKRFEPRGLKVGFIAKEIGYELRCADPVGFDAQYTRSLGASAVEFLASGQSGALMTFLDGKASPLAFEKIRDPATGRVKPRIVDPQGDGWKAALAVQSRLRAGDLSGERLKQLASVARDDPARLKERLSWTVTA